MRGLPATAVKSPAHIPWHMRGLPYWATGPQNLCYGWWGAQQNQEELWLIPLQRQADAVTKITTWHHTLGFYVTATSQK